MSEPTITLRDIRRACSNRALTRSQLDKWWVDSQAGRDPRLNLRAQIKTALDDLEDGEVAHFLVAGHSGCGKSTELVKLQTELDDFVCISFSVLDEMQPTQIVAEDLLVVMIERLLAQSEGQPWQPRDRNVESIYNYFDEVTKTTKDGRDSTLQVGVNAAASTGYFAKLLKLAANLKAEVRLNAASETTSVAKLRKRPSDLIQSVNAIVQSIMSSLEGKRLLLIVEDLDKIDLKIAREVFLENTSLLVGIQCPTVYTIPIFTFYSPEAGSLKKQFRTCSFPMIKVAEPGPNGTSTRQIGHDIVRSIVHQRIPEAAIDSMALDDAIRRTGGVLRMLFDVIRTAASTTSASIPLGDSELQYGLQSVRKEFFQQIAVPQPAPVGVSSVDDLYDRLTEHAERQLLGEKLKIKSDPTNEILLQCAALVEYNGEGWAGVHPLVIENLKELGRIT